MDFLVGTGATVSRISFVPKGSLSQDKVLTRGVKGNGEHVLSKPFLLTKGNKRLWGRFLTAEESPACLSRRDLLQSLGVPLHLSPRGAARAITGVCTISEFQDADLDIPKALEAVPGELWRRWGTAAGLRSSALGKSEAGKTAGLRGSAQGQSEAGTAAGLRGCGARHREK